MRWISPRNETFLSLQRPAIMDVTAITFPLFAPLFLQSDQSTIPERLQTTATGARHTAQMAYSFREA